MRDRLLGLDAKDFDVASSARPDQIVEILPAAVLVGASFGVVRFGAVEIATFRSESSYSDGRHPDEVRYETDPRADAARRDFTINAIFFDPVHAEYLDYFEGRRDLERREIRAVGDARARFAEDHLRLLRAVRFGARFAFTIQAETWTAMQEYRRSIRLVSAERLHDELNRMFTGPHPGHALELLRSSGLLEELVPEAELSGFPASPLSVPLSVPLAWAALLQSAEEPRVILNRFRFSHADTQATLAILRSQRLIPTARDLSLADFKRLVRQPNFEDHLRLAGESEVVDWIGQRWHAMSVEDLHPKPLLSGADLIAMGLVPGPRFSQLVAALEEAQLNGLASTRHEAIAQLGLA